MNVALIAQDGRRELMLQFCIAYCGIFSQHELWTTTANAHQISAVTGLHVYDCQDYDCCGNQRIAARIVCSEIDLVLVFLDNRETDTPEDIRRILRLCDLYNIPAATNLATAEILLRGLKCGDLQWRDAQRKRAAC